jgi:hypothetical protein
MENSYEWWYTTERECGGIVTIGSSDDVLGDLSAKHCRPTKLTDGIIGPFFHRGEAMSRNQQSFISLLKYCEFFLSFTQLQSSYAYWKLWRAGKVDWCERLLNLLRIQASILGLV